MLNSTANIGAQFIWPDEEKLRSEPPLELLVPPIDLGGFLSGDPISVGEAVHLVNEACKKHRFFLVVNHGVDSRLLSMAHDYMYFFFGLPFSEKQKAQRKKGDICGYASSFTGKFTSKLPWKETLSFQYSADDIVSSNIAANCFQGEGEFKDFGRLFQDNCKAMSNLSRKIMELLGTSLGVGKQYFREFFQGNESLMRLNYYPPCQNPNLTVGTGPHCDPTSLTILHQDHVEGLQVFIDDKWHSITPISTLS